MGPSGQYLAQDFQRFNQCPVTSLLLPSTNGSHEGHESDEGDEGRHWCHDCVAGLRLRRRNHRIESEGREGRRGGHCHDRGRSAKEEWLLQACWCAQLEAQKEARSTSS